MENYTSSYTYGLRRPLAGSESLKEAVLGGLVAAGLMISATSFAANAGLRTLAGHVPKLPAGLIAKGQLPPSQQLGLAIGLTPPDPQSLEQFLEQIYDPSNSNFRHYLTPDEFAQRFSPTAEDYNAVVDFARTKGLSVVATHSNRLLLDVSGPVANIEQAFHIRLMNYQHPTEAREFFAPDSEPSVEAQLPIADVSGLNNYVLPHPKSLTLAPQAVTNTAARLGSGSGGAYFGNDFRAAYLPGVTLTGAGQTVGLVAFDGFYASDISAYAAAARQTAVPVQTVLLDGYNGVPTTGAIAGVWRFRWISRWRWQWRRDCRRSLFLKQVQTVSRTIS